jgi:hypothetical protein
VFIEQGARHKPTSQRLVAGVFVAPAVTLSWHFERAEINSRRSDAVA